MLCTLLCSLLLGRAHERSGLPYIHTSSWDVYLCSPPSGSSPTMSDSADSPDGSALAPLPAARPRIALQATSPTFSEPRIVSVAPPTRAAFGLHPLGRPQPTTTLERTWRIVLGVLGYTGSSAQQERRRRLVQLLSTVFLSSLQVGKQYYSSLRFLVPPPPFLEEVSPNRVY